MKNVHLIGTVALAVLMCGAANLRAEDAPPASPATAPATQPAKVDEGARQLIDQISSAYSKLHALNLAGTISVVTQIQNSSPEKHSAEFTSSFVAPNRFRHEMKEDVLIGSTGQKLYSFQPQENAYTLAEAPKDRVATKDLNKNVATLLSVQDPSLLLALNKDPSEELLSDITEATKTDDASVGDVACPTLKLIQKDRSVIRAMVDPQTHLLREMVVDLTPALKERRPDLASAVVSIDYAQTTVDEPAKDESFAWSPPPGAKDADTTAAARPLDDAKTSELEGKAAPEFKLDGLDGKPVSLADLKGKVVVLDFWATWCPPCRESLPHLKKLYEAQKEKGLLVFAVNEQEEKDDVQGFVKQNSLTVPVLLDSEGKVGGQYGVTGIPQTVVIGKDGKIAKVFVGFNEGTSPAELQNAVDAAMGH